jgi:glucose/arabinose dehydrogenase
VRPLAGLTCALALWGCAPHAGSSLEGVAVEVAFPEQRAYERPLWFGPVGGDRALHAVVEQGGKVFVFEIDAQGRATAPELYLDLSARVSRLGNEEGLLGLAFHPRFEENRRLFVHYSVAGARMNRLSELHAGSGWPLDPATERVLLEVPQPYRNHNGGHLLFDPQGLLLIGLGDGGGGGDPERSAQDVGSLLGSILRIDIDHAQDGAAYAVPHDNPFLGVEGARPELWAIGQRNPWRFDVDPATGLVWVGDVGQVRFEEVTVLAAGANGGWPLREGRSDYDPAARRGPGEWIEPVFTYGRSLGVSITGGVVQRAGSVPALRGCYVFGDYGSGRIWSLPAALRPGEESQARDVGRILSPTHFGLDARGELYATSFDGRVYRFVTRGRGR